MSLLLTPGPVKMPEAVLRALAQPMIHHRAPEFKKCLENVLSRLPMTFQTRGRVMILPSTGTGAMEAALVNLHSPGDEVLFLDIGKFGERWYKMAKVYSLRADRTQAEWGDWITAERVLDHLKNKKVKSVFFQACDTSTATQNPVKEIATAVREKFPDVLLIVDAITALGSSELLMDEWGLDAVVAGSQKVFMIPTGISFVAFSERAWRANAAAQCPRFYFDLAKERDANLRGETFVSSCVSHIRALEAVIDLFHGEALDRQIQRCAQLARATRGVAPRLGLGIFSKHPADSVTALEVPKGMDGSKLRAHLEIKHGVTLMGGQDQLRGKILRMGHMGDISNEDMIQAFRGLGKCLMDFSAPGVNESILKECEMELRRRL